ncbi:hypothetical protein B0H14DRAFT_2655957 [Mycena olivaceomarginata]|nr:hypothetical protein B0H14DRAFT_2655957 [Mycena olivaceomarginata]
MPPPHSAKYRATGGTAAHVVAVTLDGLDGVLALVVSTADPNDSAPRSGMPNSCLTFVISTPPISSHTHMTEQNLLLCLKPRFPPASSAAGRAGNNANQCRSRPGRCSRLGVGRCGGVWVNTESTVLLPFGDTAFQRTAAALRPSRISVDHGFDNASRHPKNKLERSPIVPDPHASALGHQVHRIATSRLGISFVAHGGKTPISGVMGRVFVVGDHLRRRHADAPLPRQCGFPHLRVLWGDTPLPPPQHHFGVPTSPPWAGPVVDAATAEAERRNEIMRVGKSLPAHLYSEDSSPTPAWWWPANIKCLHCEASDKELYLKYKFRLRFPFRPQLHVGRATHSVDYLHERMLLNARLEQKRPHPKSASSYAIFFLRTRLEDGITSSAAAQAGALTAARAADAAAAAAAALEYTQLLLDDDFLAAWLVRPVVDVALWGTAHDPRDALLPPVNTRGWANTGGWGQRWYLGDGPGMGRLATSCG